LKHRLFLLAASLATLMIVAAGPALATVGTKDQFQENTAGTSTYVAGQAQMDGQLFTAGITGNLVEVDLYVNTIIEVVPPAVIAPNLTDAVTVSIHAVVSGHPDSSSLGNWHGTVSGENWNQFVFSTAIPVTSGTQYAIVVTPDTNQRLTLGGSCTSSDYTGGNAQIYDSGWSDVPSYDDGSCIQQWGFRTFVATGSTLPPTASSSAPAAPAGNSALPLLVAGVFGALAFVALRRVDAERN
jgi:hypothetical protein